MLVGSDALVRAGLPLDETRTELDRTVPVDAVRAAYDRAPYANLVTATP